MSLAKLEGELIRAKEGMDKARVANESFERVLQEMSILKSRSIANPQTKEQIVQEFKKKEILDLFSSIEVDFEELRQKMTKQSIEKEQILDFIESIRTRKSFSFTETEKSISFLEKTIDALEATHIAVRPEFIGLVDLAPLAVEMGLARNNSGVIVERERLSEFIVSLIAKKSFHDLVFETDNAKISLKTFRELSIEAENAQVKTIARIASHN